MEHEIIGVVIARLSIPVFLHGQVFVDVELDQKRGAGHELDPVRPDLLQLLLGRLLFHEKGVHHVAIGEGVHALEVAMDALISEDAGELVHHGVVVSLQLIVLPVAKYRMYTMSCLVLIKIT